jgi:hypothetical protein
MLQSYAIRGGTRIRILDLQPDDSTPVNTLIETDGRRWKPGDLSPVVVEMDYHDGVLACERNPLRFKPELQPDALHAELVKAFKEAQS